jgi:hypothetical protein
MEADPGHSALFRRMNVLNMEGSISQVEWDIASLYVVELQKEDRPADYVSALRVNRPAEGQAQASVTTPALPRR